MNSTELSRFEDEESNKSNPAVGEDTEETQPKEPIIGDYKPKRKFLSFVSAVNGAKIRYIRDVAFVEGKHLSGILEGAIFKITICDEGTIKFEEQEGTSLSNDAMIKSLIEDIDNMGVTGYAQKFVLAGIKFTDVDGKLCYLEVEHKKPVDVLATLFDEEEDSIEEQSKEISEKGLSALDALLSFDDEEEEEAEEEEEEAEEDQDKEDANDAPEQSHSEYLQDMFKKMNEEKERELKNRIEEKLNEIKRADADISMAEKKKKEGTEQLRVLESRLESLKPQEEPNGIVFHVSEEIKPETGLDESTRHVADKIADLLNLKKDVLFAQLTEGYYVIKMAGKEDFTKGIPTDKYKEITTTMKTIDPEGKFQMSMENGVIEIEYRGELNWHQLTTKLMKKGFEQDEEFDKVAGSNSYAKEEEADIDIEEIKSQIKKNSGTHIMDIELEDVEKPEEGEYHAVDIYETDKPEHIVIYGYTDDGGDFRLTDDFSSFDVRVDNKPVKSKYGTLSVETMGFAEVMTLKQYIEQKKSEVEEFGDDGVGEGIEALLIPNLNGKIQVGVQFSDGTYAEDIDMGEYLMHQFNDDRIDSIFVNIPEGHEVILLDGENDVEVIKAHVRDEAIAELLND